MCVERERERGGENENFSREMTTKELLSSVFIGNVFLNLMISREKSLKGDKRQNKLFFRKYAQDPYHFPKFNKYS